ISAMQNRIIAWLYQGHLAVRIVELAITPSEYRDALICVCHRRIFGENSFILITSVFDIRGAFEGSLEGGRLIFQ
ncbi:hypothetical protein, partial [Haloferula sp.]|uniref:hypothetical protein n=1 Tax=Haloferula sp. TaxID=2497595 RepID=UPI00329B84EB